MQPQLDEIKFWSSALQRLGLLKRYSRCRELFPVSVHHFTGSVFAQVCSGGDAAPDGRGDPSSWYQQFVTSPANANVPGVVCASASFKQSLWLLHFFLWLGQSIRRGNKIAADTQRIDGVAEPAKEVETTTTPHEFTHTHKHTQHLERIHTCTQNLAGARI